MGNLLSQSYAKPRKRSKPSKQTKTSKGRRITLGVDIPWLADLLRTVEEGVTHFLNNKEDRGQVRLDGEHRRKMEASYMKWQQALFTSRLTENVASCLAAVTQGPGALEKIGVQIHGELQSQTTLTASKDFAEHVYRWIAYMADDWNEESPELYFLHHPDTIWHSRFYQLVRRRPLSGAVLGMSENLGTICAWMAFIRAKLRRMDTRRKRPREVQFHLLIPAYRPMVIDHPITFDTNLLPLTIHGDIDAAEKLVWLNVPTIDEFEPGRLELERIGNIKDIVPSGMWDQCKAWCGSFFTPKPPIRLGEIDPDFINGNDDQEGDERHRQEFGFQSNIGHVSRGRHSRHRRRDFSGNQLRISGGS